MLTKEELEQVAIHFGVQPALTAEQIRISDGIASIYQNVWWKASNGPEYVSLQASNHLQNAKSYPDVYSIDKPKVWCSYSKPDGVTWVLG
jgi:hypothetical protein